MDNVSETALTERQIGYLLGIDEVAQFIANRRLKVNFSPLSLKKELYDAIIRLKGTVENV